MRVAGAWQEQGDWTETRVSSRPLAMGHWRTHKGGVQKEEKETTARQSPRGKEGVEEVLWSLEKKEKPQHSHHRELKLATTTRARLFNGDKGSCQPRVVEESEGTRCGVVVHKSEGTSWTGSDAWEHNWGADFFNRSNG